MNNSTPKQNEERAKGLKKYKNICDVAEDMDELVEEASRAESTPKEEDEMIKDKMIKGYNLAIFTYESKNVTIKVLDKNGKMLENMNFVTIHDNDEIVICVRKELK